MRRRLRQLAAVAVAIVALVAPTGSPLAAQPGLPPANPFALPQPLYEHAVVGCSEVMLVAGARVAAAGVSGRRATRLAHVRSDGVLRISHPFEHVGAAIEIDGDLVLGPQGELVASGRQPLVAGEERRAGAAIDCQAVDLALLAAELPPAERSELPATELGRSPLDATGSFLLGRGDALTLPPGRYRFERFEVEAEAELRLEGRVEVLVTGGVTIRGRVNGAGDPFRLRLWVGNDGRPAAPVILTGDARLNAFLFAPDATVQLGGGSRLEGGVLADRVHLPGGARVERTVDDQAPRLVLHSPLRGQVLSRCAATVRGESGDEQSAVALTLNGEGVAIGEEGRFSAPVSFNAEDAGRIVAMARDRAGNETRREVWVAVAAPRVALTVPAPGALVAERIVDLEGSASLATEVRVEGEAAELTGSGWRLRDFDLGKDGLKPLELEAAGCSGSSTGVALLDLDTLPPAISIDTPAPGATVASSPITVSGQVEDAHLSEVTVGEVTATVVGTRFTATGVELAAGENRLVATAVDALGRRTSSQPVTVRLETGSPEIVITSPAAGALLDRSTVDVAGRVAVPDLAEVRVGLVLATVDGGRFVAAGVPLVEGENRLVAIAIDARGSRIPSPAVVVAVDTLAPEVTIDAERLASLTANEAITVLGTVRDPHLLGVSVNGVAATVVGEEFAAEAVPLFEGGNRIVAVAIDRLDHESATHPVEVVRDSLPPEVSITEPAEAAELSARRITVRGIVRDPHLDRVEIGAVEATIEGDRFEAVGVVLDEGAGEIVARAFDRLGHAADSPPVAVVVDSLPPVVELDRFEREVVATATVTVTGTATDVHLDSVSVGGVAASIEGSRFRAEGVALAEGGNEVVAEATDTFGHRAVSAPERLVVDTVPPELVLESPLAGVPITSRQVAVVGRALDPHLDRVLVMGSAIPVAADGRFDATVAVVDATEPLAVEAVDRAGNRTLESVALVLDTVPPTITLDEPAAGACLAAGEPVTLTGTFSDPDPATGENGEPPAVRIEVRPAGGKAVRSYVAALEAAPAGAGSGRRWSVSGVDLGSADGAAQVTVIASDRLGNRAQLAASLPVDATPPIVTLTADGAPFAGAAAGEEPPSDADPLLFGHRLAFAARVVDGSGAAPPPATLTLNGSPYLAGTPIEADGDYLVAARAVDCAGHVASSHALVRIDQTPPRLLSTDPAAGAMVTTGVPTYRGRSDPDLDRASIGGRPATVAAGDFSLSPYLWTEGENRVAIELVDRAGNRAVYERRFTVDSLALTLEILEQGQPMAPGSLFLRPVVPVVRASAAAVTVTANLNGEPFVSGSEIATSGVYTLEASAADVNGRTASRSIPFTVDLSAGPTIEIRSPSDGATVSQLSTTVSGAVAGDRPTVTVNGRPAVVDAGLFTASEVPLEAGTLNELVALAVDARGRRRSDVVSVRAETGGPQVLILEPADGTLTNRDRIDVAGVVVGGPEATADGDVLVSGRRVALDLEGSFRAVDLPLALGENRIVAEAVDAAGRRGAASVSVIADREPPSIRFTVDDHPLREGTSFARPIELGVEIEDTGAGLTTALVRLNGAPQPTAAGPITLGLEEEGGYVVAVVAADRAGNETRAERSLVLDFGGCRLTEIEPPAGSALVADRVSLRGRSGGALAVRVRVVDPAGPDLVFEASLADGTFLAGDLPLPVVGENRIEIVCEAAGGPGAPLVHPIVRLAAGAGPAIEIEAPAAGSLLAGDAVEVSGRVIEGAGSSVTVNGLPALLSRAAGDLEFAIEVPLVEGPNILSARAIDAAGREGADRVVIGRDSQPPRITITRPEHSSPVGIAGSGPPTIVVTGVVDLDTEPNLDRVTVSSPAGSVVAEVDRSSGVFVAAAVPLDPALAGEPQTLTAIAVDTLGHAGRATADVRFDPLGPAVLLEEPADLTLYGADAPGELIVSGEAWAVEGSQIELNGALVDPVALVWEAAAADGRRHAEFTLSISLPTIDGPFGIVARVSDPEGRVAQDRLTLQRDTAAPEVIEMVPGDGSSGVDANALFLVLFSEPILHPSLGAADGLTLVRRASGEQVVGKLTVAGNAVGFAPGSRLEAGESYTFRAGAEITDLAGQPLLSPVEASFEVAPTGTAEAPAVDPLPAVLCAESLTVTGRATPGLTLEIRDGPFFATGFAAADGRFEVVLPLSGDGYHLLRIAAVDPLSDRRSPETTAVIQLDCGAPVVVDAAFDRSTGVIELRFSEAVDAATLAVGGAVDAIRLADAEDPSRSPHPATVRVLGSEVELELASGPDAFWRERPLRLMVGAPAADLEGNVMRVPFETVFFPGGGDLAGGFLFGESYDDASGRPLSEVTARLYAAGGALPGTVPAGSEAPPVAIASTGGRGRYTIAAELPAGRYVLLLERAGYTRGVRRLALEPSRGAVPFDSRLTPLAESAGRLDPVAGGRVENGLLALEADAAALPGSEEVAVRLTPLSGQGLPDVLPLGWTPAAALDLTLTRGPDGEVLTPLAEIPAGSLRLELPLPDWLEADDPIVAVEYRLETGLWHALPPLESVVAPDGTAMALLMPRGPGAVALVVPDSDPATRPPLPAIDGEAVQGVPRPTMPPLVAEMTLEPEVVTATGRSLVRVIARSNDGVTPWPSGLAVQAFLEEVLILAAGAGRLLEAPLAADLLLYHPRLDPTESGGDPPGAVGALTFAVSPSPRAAEVLLEVGFENVRLFPFPEELERGQIIGPPGGVVGPPGGPELRIPEGGLTAAVAARVELLSAAELAALPAVDGFTTLTAVRIDLGGETLRRPATLTLPAPVATPAPLGGDPRILLAELIEAPADFRGSLVRLAARSERQPSAGGERIVASPDRNGPLPLDSIVREGTYLLLYAEEPIGYATGLVRGANGAPLADARVAAAGLGTADLARLGGRYAIPVPAAGAPLQALHPASNETGEANAPGLPPDQIVAIDLTIEPQPPTVLALSPADGAIDQPLGTVVSVLFSEPLDPDALGTGTLQLELLDPAGHPSGLFVAGTVALSADRVRVVFSPERPLLPGRTYRVRFTGGVRDAGGTRYAGPIPVVWQFSTSTVIVPGGQIDPSRFHLRLPVAGVAELFADPGAIPAVLAGDPTWSVTPEVAGSLDPVVETLSALLDGSFSTTVGRPPAFPVTIADEVFVKVFDPSGELAAHFRVGPFTSPDGLGFVAPGGEEVRFRTAEGIEVEVPPLAFDEPTLVTVRSRPLAGFGGLRPPGLEVGALTSIDFDGEARDTLRLHVPAPAAVPDGAQVFVGREISLPWGRRLELLTVGGVLELDGERFLSNDPSLQPEPPPDAFISGVETPAARALSEPRSEEGEGEDDEDPETCADIRRRGIHPCFVREMLIEFRLRTDAIWYYNLGAEWGLVTGKLGSVVAEIGGGLELMTELVADSWVQLRRPRDSPGEFWILPVVTDQPFVVARRDVATGWTLNERAYDPIDEIPGGLAVVDPLGDDLPLRPMLIAADPFELLRFRAPPAQETELLRLEIEAVADPAGRVTLRAREDFELADHTRLDIFDLDPLTPDREEESGPADPDRELPEPEGPEPGPTVRVCEDRDSWESSPFTASDEMLLVLTPGDLDPRKVEVLSFQFDQPLRDLAELEPDQVAVLEVLGPAEACESGGGDSRFPRELPFEIEQKDGGRRLLIRPLTTLPAGHRFRLELKSESLLHEESGLAYWETAPREFDFATREVPGEVIGSADENEFPFGVLGSGDIAQVRDLLRFGNLLVVASDTGQIVTLDTGDVTEERKFTPHSIKNGLAQPLRALATDGHNRLFYSGLFGEVWTVKSVRLEDARSAEEECVGRPEWAQSLPCFSARAGAVRVAYGLGFGGGLTAAEFLAGGLLPVGTPSEMEILTQDEIGKTLALADFVETYTDGTLADFERDDEGFYTIDLELESTHRRNGREPSQDRDAAPEPIETFREEVCEPEEEYDRFQRVTVDNLSTGQSWSLDIENRWPSDPESTGNGKARLEGLRAKRGDRLRVRYSLRAFGYLAILGSGITVVDLNRFYRLEQPGQVGGNANQCGRRLGIFEGATAELPECSPVGAAMEGLALTPAIAVHSQTGCPDGAEEEEPEVPCRGEEAIDVYTPLVRVGTVHTSSELDDPGKLEVAELAACIDEVAEEPAWLRDVALANDVRWLDHGFRGEYDGRFLDPDPGFLPRALPDLFPDPDGEGDVKEVDGDLLFQSLGLAGIFVFDVSERTLEEGKNGTLIGHLKVEGHSAFRLQVDRDRDLLFAGGIDDSGSEPEPVIDVWDLRFVNGAPDKDHEPQPLLSIHAPWRTPHLAIDPTGTGLLYTWDREEGPLAVPFESPRFLFSGLYLPEEEDEEPMPALPPGPGDPDPDAREERPSAVHRITRRFVPLGVPMETTLELEEEKRDDNERSGTAVFKLRLALPGSFGEVLTAKVQALRSLPDERLLGQEDLGAAVAPPGGPGWPEPERVVTLRRLGTGPEEADAAADLVDGESGRFANVFNLYESVETIVLVADPRAREDYHLQDEPDGSAEGSETADEAAQCRRCEWPQYLPDPKDPKQQDDPELETVEVLLAGGRWVRAFLFAEEDRDDDPPGPGSSPPEEEGPERDEAEARRNTRAAIEYFTEQEENWRLPWGLIEVAAAAAPVPSPLQVSLAEPAQNPALWGLGEAGADVLLTGGEAVLTHTDHRIAGRGIPFSFERTYRSGTLGYGPLGSAGWSANLFSSLREITTTGEVEYHDGRGHVWRFYPRDGDDPPEGYEDDPGGTYQVPEGLFLRLQKLTAGQGWRLMSPQHHAAYFDAAGRLVALSDRHRRGGDPDAQGNTLELHYDPFGQLVGVEDDLGRKYELEYYDDPRPERDGGDGPRYGLLETITDFVDRTLEYEYSDDRLLEEVKLPEVTRSAEPYSDLTYEGEEGRPSLRYEYDPERGVTDEEIDTTAILHGDFAQLRLGAYFLPAFVEAARETPRLRLDYDSESGRVDALSVPDRDDVNGVGGGVRWELESTPVMGGSVGGPAAEVRIREPWNHLLEYVLEKGRTTVVREELEVIRSDSTLPSAERVERSFAYADDGRLISTTEPDGGRRSQCYADGAGGGGCGGSGGAVEEIDRLQRLNATNVVHASTAGGGEGSALYSSITTSASYQEDNLPAEVTDDGLGRPIALAVPMAGESSMLAFRTEGVTGEFDYDAYGRVERYVGGGLGGPQVRIAFGEDENGKRDAGLPIRREHGSEGATRFSESFEYDDAFNVSERRTSFGRLTTIEYDEWDRAIQTVSGDSEDGRFAPLGLSGCGERGSVVERGYDASGHVVRERRLQDYVTATGALSCRFIEMRYTYNAREQLLDVEQDHLASPLEPGVVDPLLERTRELRYDEFGRLEEDVAFNRVDPPLVTRYRYDPAGRVAGVRVGSAGEQRRGYDENSRLVLTTDGDEGLWRGRYDVWDRLFHESHPTGLFVLRRFDEAHNLTSEETFDGDPLVGSGELLSAVRSHFTSFDEPDRVVTLLDAGTTGEERRITEQRFDESGRVIEILRGPPAAGGAALDLNRARREAAYLYELDAGRVLLESYGGEAGGPALYAYRYRYDGDNESPWPDGMDYLESVPEESELVETYSTRYRRDTLGRPIREQMSDGSLVITAYDRLGRQPIQVRTGAQTTSAVAMDARGLVVRHFRPNGRGSTSYAYDLDGRLRRQLAETADGSGPWETLYAYDDTQRVVATTHDDGTVEEILGYNPDNTPALVRTRDGIELELDYDAANRLRSVVPGAATLPPTLVPLDAGDFFDYDELSRLVEARRGSAGTSEADPSLRVAYPSGYDLESRPRAEVVGTRSPLGWSYDTWNRPVEVRLPLGAGRGGEEGGGFAGFERGYDTLDRLVDVSGLSGELAASRLGVAWSWGGRDRLYATTSAAALGTGSRLGYIAGRGAQPPSDGSGDASRWKLGTLSWGASAGVGPMETPDPVWGQFGFGWRGVDGLPQDGAKLGREVMAPLDGLGFFSGMGWSWGYDDGVRLAAAVSGPGSVDGRGEPGELGDRYGYEYGRGDELESELRASSGRVELEHGEDGRLLARDGESFAYDQVGRRTEDGRFLYRWSWRSELMSVEVKREWPGGEISPFAGHKVIYAYDALGRLLERTHLAALPEGESDDALRGLIEKRVYVWEGDGLLVEAGYGDREATQLRWRKTYVPGPSGLDDAVQVIVDVVDLPVGAVLGRRLYTYLRDELGTVLGLVAEDEGADPFRPPIPVRYLYTPYGEVHVESGPELRRARFDAGISEVGGLEQAVADLARHQPGGVRLRFSAPVDVASLGDGIVVEQATPAGWLQVSGAELVRGLSEEASEVLVMLQGGWERSRAYRVRVGTGLEGLAGRPFAGEKSVQWTLPSRPDDIGSLSEYRFPVEFESYLAAGNTVGGRFPGGQTCLFQGLWTDPVTGISYARARWYDARSASWLLEDPALDIDSPNLYAFVRWQPNEHTDPTGKAIYFFDGTWNCMGEPGNEPTNIERMYLAAKESGANAYYVKGVGCSDSDVERFTEAGFGLAGGRLTEMYRALVRFFEAGDKTVDIVGYSRGAYLARAFANYLIQQGVPIKGTAQRVMNERGTWTVEKRETPTIRFIGLFDTVASRQGPLGGMDVGGMVLGDPLAIAEEVQYVRHATARDETRLVFPLTSIHANPETRNSARRFEKSFPGVHSDVGGGDGLTDTISYGPLKWMTHEGRRLGVPFGDLKPPQRPLPRDPTPFIHDSRWRLDFYWQGLYETFVRKKWSRIIYYPPTSR